MVDTFFTVFYTFIDTSSDGEPLTVVVVIVISQNIVIRLEIFFVLFGRYRYHGLQVLFRKSLHVIVNVLVRLRYIHGKDFRFRVDQLHEQCSYSSGGAVSRKSVQE